MIILHYLIKIILKKLFLIFLLLLNLQYNYCQSATLTDSTISKLKSFVNQLYGADYQLINGIRYINLYPSADGHPYIGEDRFYRAKLGINKRIYNNVEIKYDICNQKVILQYPHFSGNTDKIILNNEFIDEFEIDGRLFRKYTFNDVVPRFCQVVAQGNIDCIYYWNKELLKGLSASSFFTYSPEIKTSYLVIDHKLYPFRGRKSFVKLFPSKYHKEIISFLKSNNIWFRDANDTSIQHLMVYCNKLVQGN